MKPSAKKTGSARILRVPLPEDLHAGTTATAQKLGMDPADMARIGLVRVLEEYGTTGKIGAGSHWPASVPPPDPEDERPRWEWDPSCRIGLGWPDVPVPKPTVHDLLAPDELRQMLDIWHATGCNYLSWAVAEVVADVVDGTAHKAISEFQQNDLIARLEEVRRKWKAQEAHELSAHGKEGGAA